jgi:hypothetical protein
MVFEDDITVNDQALLGLEESPRIEKDLYSFGTGEEASQRPCMSRSVVGQFVETDNGYGSLMASNGDDAERRGRHSHAERRNEKVAEPGNDKKIK